MRIDYDPLKALKWFDFNEPCQVVPSLNSFKDLEIYSSVDCNNADVRSSNRRSIHDADLTYRPAVQSLILRKVEAMERFVNLNVTLAVSAQQQRARHPPNLGTRISKFSLDAVSPLVPHPTLAPLSE
jgi:hypothetical protein